MKRLEDREHMFDVAHQHWLENRKLDELIAQKKREKQAEESNKLLERQYKEINDTLIKLFKWLFGILAFYAFCDFVGK